MQPFTNVELTRECEAVQIPAGTAAVLPRGMTVELTQTLGGSYTVRTPDGLFRIGSKDADALGLTAPAAAPAEATSSGPVDELAVWGALKTCYDPEIPVNIVELGLVYDLHLEPLPTGRTKVNVKMTLTAPGCGMGATIAADAQGKLLDLPGVEDANVQIVWDPPWHPSMISPAGRAQLGME